MNRWSDTVGQPTATTLYLTCLRRNIQICSLKDGGVQDVCVGGGGFAVSFQVLICKISGNRCAGVKEYNRTLSTHCSELRPSHVIGQAKHAAPPSGHFVSPQQWDFKAIGQTTASLCHVKKKGRSGMLPFLRQGQYDVRTDLFSRLITLCCLKSHTASKWWGVRQE